MAEAHPVGFQWVMEAKQRGAKVFHVDPRFTRTSALADTLPADPGGHRHRACSVGWCDYILDNELDFREYVLAYTNAATIVSEEFGDTEDLRRALLRLRPGDRHATTRPAGSTRATRTRPAAGTRAQGAGHRGRAGARVARRAGAGATAPRDETLQHPRCVYQILKRHFARYTPEMVERVCGIPQDKFLELAEAWTENSGRERTGGAGLLGGLDAAQRRRAVHPHRRDHPAAAGQHGPARVAASWRCAGTPASRAPPTSRRCSTCCRATCRCRTTPTTRPSTTGWTASGTPARRASGATPSRTRPACSRRTGATRRRRRTTSATATCPG